MSYQWLTALDNQMRRNQSGNMQKLKNMQVRSAIAVISKNIAY